MSPQVSTCCSPLELFVQMEDNMHESLVSSLWKGEKTRTFGCLWSRSFPQSHQMDVHWRKSPTRSQDSLSCHSNRNPRENGCGKNNEFLVHRSDHKRRFLVTYSISLCRVHLQMRNRKLLWYFAALVCKIIWFRMSVNLPKSWIQSRSVNQRE